MKTWCDKCQEDEAEYKVRYRTDKYLPKYSSLNGEIYVTSVCASCYEELGKLEDIGEIWSTSTKHLTSTKGA